ncbi:hypothetical protein Acr_24g0003590 [Actinidia rufa]|uniref:Leucine-rich repeat-containing N-terminal plant-type domain-containing protein n=1 Tax=Actinidia rufa TaxID=165716 RepID=A0A7J0GTL1_9ERIC|nr:hypothetical protein Acr_24g0003590 [Actinidia rufa]
MEKTSFLYLPTLVLTHYFLPILALAATNYTTDQSALLAFKAHITDDPNNILAHNWTTATSICQWIGVSCTARHHRVTALNLPNMGFSGTIPPHIGNLSFLALVNISSNKFYGHIPTEFARLRRLKVAKFDGNLFSGSLPLRFFDIPSLQLIDFSNNSINDSLPEDLCSGRLSELRVLSLSMNEFYGHIPSTLGECRELQYLKLIENRFNGVVPRGIGNLTMLKGLYLGENNLEGEIPIEIGNLLSLEVLSIKIAGLTGYIPSSIFNISSLKKIHLKKNNLFGQNSELMGSRARLTLFPVVHHLYLERLRPNKVASVVEGDRDRIPVRTWIIYQVGLRFPISPMLNEVMAQCRSHLQASVGSSIPMIELANVSTEVEQQWPSSKDLERKMSSDEEGLDAPKIPSNSPALFDKVDHSFVGGECGDSNSNCYQMEPKDIVPVPTIQTVVPVIAFIVPAPTFVEPSLPTYLHPKKDKVKEPKAVMLHRVMTDLIAEETLEASSLMVMQHVRARDANAEVVAISLIKIDVARGKVDKALQDLAKVQKVAQGLVYQRYLTAASIQMGTTTLDKAYSTKAVLPDPHKSYSPMILPGINEEEFANQIEEGEVKVETPGRRRA